VLEKDLMQKRVLLSAPRDRVGWMPIYHELVSWCACVCVAWVVKNLILTPSSLEACPS
jgi:hypothetical protein